MAAAPNNCEQCEAILHELEHIDDETDQIGILLVTTDDMNVATKKANVTEFPALILFRNEEPIVYKGNAYKSRTTDFLPSVAQALLMMAIKYILWF